MSKELTMWQRGGKNSRKNVSKERATEIGTKAGKASGKVRRARAKVPSKSHASK